MILLVLPLSLFAAKTLSFTAKDLDGKSVTSDVFKNSKVTMINIWATYCSPCLKEMPYLAEIAKERDPEQFQIIGIISDAGENISESDRSVIKEFLTMIGAEYPQLLLNQSLYDSVVAGTMAVPTTIFVDNKGNVLSTVIGSNNKKGWNKKIDEVLKKL